MTTSRELPVIVIDYQPLLYYAEEELQLSIKAIHMWATWFPDHFIILSHVEGDD